MGMECGPSIGIVIAGACIARQVKRRTIASITAGKTTHAISERAPGRGTPTGIGAVAACSRARHVDRMISI